MSDAGPHNSSRAAVQPWAEHTAADLRRVIDRCDADHRPGEVSRATLVQLGSKCLHDGDADDLLMLWIADMTWCSGTTNGRGPWRIYQKLTGRPHAARVGTDAPERHLTGLIGTLSSTFEQIVESRPSPRLEPLKVVTAEFPIYGVGPAFFTKWMWASALAADAFSPVALVLDARVRETLNAQSRMGEIEPSPFRGASCYCDYVQLLREIAVELGRPSVTAGKIENLLFWRDPISHSALIDWLCQRSDVSA